MVHAGGAAGLGPPSRAAAAGAKAEVAAAGARARGVEEEGSAVVTDAGAAVEPRSVGGAQDVGVRPLPGVGPGVDSGVRFAAATGGAVEAAATAAVELGDGSLGTAAGCSVENGQG